MTTFYTNYYYHPSEIPSDYDMGFGGSGEGDSGNSYGGRTDAAKSKSLQIIVVNGNTVEITPGQRKVGGPPHGFVGQAPSQDCEIFCGKIPRDIFEDELLPLFVRFGAIWDLRLMMNPTSSKSRGYAFIKFKDASFAREAVQKMDGHEIRPGKTLSVTLCKPKVRLFVGNIPKVKGREELMTEFCRHTEGLTDVIVYNSPDEKKKNRGFCFLEYLSHKHAYIAKKKLSNTPLKFWGCDIIVDWADPLEEPDAEIMSKVRVLYVRNLTQNVTQERLRQQFVKFGNIERVKKIKDYAFVHFECREAASNALKALNGKLVSGTNLEVTWAKPPTDKKKRETILRARERRTMQLLTQSPRISGDSYRYSPHGVSYPSMSTGRGDFNDFGSWAESQHAFRENEFYQYCPYLKQNYQRPLPYDNQIRPESWHSQFREPRESRPTMTWTRGGRRPPNSFGQFERSYSRGPAADDENWRANCGRKPTTPIPVEKVRDAELEQTPTTVDPRNNRPSSSSAPTLDWRNHQ